MTYNCICMFVYACMYVCMYVYAMCVSVSITHTHVYIYIQTHTYTHNIYSGGRGCWIRDLVLLFETSGVSG